VANVTSNDDLATDKTFQGTGRDERDESGARFAVSSSRFETRYFPCRSAFAERRSQMRPDRETAPAQDAAKDRTKTGRNGLHFGFTRVYDWRVGKARDFRWGGRRSRPAALAVSLLAASLAFADGASAQAAALTAPTSGALTMALGQIAQQTAQTLQSAGAQATAVQVQPTNVAVPVAIESPGSSTVIAQGNAAGAGATSANSSKTTQGTGQSKGGSPASPSAGTVGGLAPDSASGGPAQASVQAGQTAQNVGAQATTVQAVPINIAIPIMVGSPGGSIVVVQTNAASSGAAAGNASSTAQTSGQAATGPAALPGQPGTAAPVAPGAALAGTAPGGAPSVPAPTLSGTTLIWNSIWNWTINVTVPSVQLPAFPRWAFPGHEARTAAPARAERDKAAPARRAPLVSTWTPGGPGLDLAAAPAETTNGVSSSIVQRPKAASEPALKPFVPLPLQLPAPSAGPASVPAGLVVGALVFLALFLGSLGLLVGRLSLASAPWRHQAYLTPLQRPG
jgi:hypothetical protein